MNPTFAKAITALVPTGMLLVGSNFNSLDGNVL